MVFGSNLVVLTFSPVNPTIFYLFPRNIVNLQPGVYPRSTWAIDYDYYLLFITCLLPYNEYIIYIIFAGD